MRFRLHELPVPMVYATHRIIRDCNEEFATLFGYGRAELIDRSFARLYPKHADFVRTGRMWGAHLPGGKVYYDERIMMASDGRRFWCQVHGRTRHATDPFAQAIYCFQPLARPVVPREFSLTDRQRQIVTLVAQGKTNAQIADEIGISIRTVESHRARLMKATGLTNAAELAAWFSMNAVG
ncbi:LuxR C-terminal-related transcriptional regulator [Shinella sp. HY16]|nr:LuxR C-terminal-related transcriptional regulator [Shinella sp. HY16]MDC7273831.1 LuxR C-terminal-related transcriptional regulator [Shinella sp. YZ44]